MKKYINILLFLFVTVLTACYDDSTSIQPVEEGKKVELDMSVTLGEMSSASSRALGEYSQYADGNHPSLWVVVFDKNGVLVEAHDITPIWWNGQRLPTNGSNRELP